MSYVVSPEATWACLVLLLAIHLGMNHRAVRAVKMNTLNRQRACLCLSHLFDTGQVLSPAEVSERERIFERSSFIRWNGGSGKVRAKIGVSLGEIASALGTADRVTGSVKTGAVSLVDLLGLFKAEGYVLWYDESRQVILIALEDTAKPISPLKAWAHAILLEKELRSLSKEERHDAGTLMDVMISIEHTLRGRWEADTEKLVAAGWDLETASLETTSGTRIAFRKDMGIS